MGEAKQKQLSKGRMLKAADRCVYCSNAVVDTVEHMPPTGLFKETKDRVGGCLLVVTNVTVVHRVPMHCYNSFQC